MKPFNPPVARPLTSRSRPQAARSSARLQPPSFRFNSIDLKIFPGDKFASGFDAKSSSVCNAYRCHAVPWLWTPVCFPCQCEAQAEPRKGAEEITGRGAGQGPTAAIQSVVKSWQDVTSCVLLGDSRHQNGFKRGLDRTAPHHNQLIFARTLSRPWRTFLLRPGLPESTLLGSAAFSTQASKHHVELEGKESEACKHGNRIHTECH